MTTQILLPANFALQSFDDGLTGNGVLQSLPRDPASIFALILIVASAIAVVWFGRPRGGGTKTPA